MREADYVAGLRDMVRAARFERGLSCHEVAEAASRNGERISECEVNRLENRYQRLPPPDVFRQVVEVLELDPMEILRRCGYLW